MLGEGRSPVRAQRLERWRLVRKWDAEGICKGMQNRVEAALLVGAQGECGLCACVSVRVHGCECVTVYTCESVSGCVCINACTSVCVYVCLYRCVYVMSVHSPLCRWSGNLLKG